LKWRQTPGNDGTQVMLSTWDRQGLLAKAAAALSAVRLNIVQAHVFTRSDNVVLDVFTVVDFHSGGPASATRLEEMKFLLEGALGEPPRFASIWACTQHKYLAPRSRIPARIAFDNHSSATATIVAIAASDRLGLLYDIFQVIADSGLNITHARIETLGAIAHDLVQVTEAHGQKVSDPGRLASLRQKLEAAVNVET
jgi:[protein-PII] uridylyltransferase